MVVTSEKMIFLSKRTFWDSRRQRPPANKYLKLSTADTIINTLRGWLKEKDERRGRVEGKGRGDRRVEGGTAAAAAQER